jgi:hypothetical protein
VRNASQPTFLHAAKAILIHPSAWKAIFYELRIDGFLRSSPNSTRHPRASGRPLHTSDHYSPGSVVFVPEAGTLLT